MRAIDNGFTRPPMGWSALYGAPFSTVNEAIVQDAAAGLAAGGWASAGYKYVVLDDWYAERGPDGRMRATNATFPHGIRATSDYIHSLGLKFGVYSAASQRTCGNFSASQFQEQLDADTFANDWQVDWLKYDSCYCALRARVPPPAPAVLPRPHRKTLSPRQQRRGQPRALRHDARCAQCHWAADFLLHGGPGLLSRRGQHGAHGR